MIELTSKIRKCRVKHRCTWCGEYINPMEKAQYRSGVYDGNFFSEYWHIECFDAVQRSEYNEEFYPFDQKRGKTFEESHDE